MLNLLKGQKISLTKQNPKLDNILIGLGWDINQKDSTPYDLDSAVFLLGKDNKVLSESDFIFYNNPIHTSGAVKHLGDNIDGSGDGDDEQITIQLSKIPNNVTRLAFTVTINEAVERHQNFGNVSNAFIRVVDLNSNTELLHFNLTEKFSLETAIVVAEIYKYNDEWKFSAIGNGFVGGLKSLCENFGISILDDEDHKEVNDVQTNSIQINENLTIEQQKVLTKINLRKESISKICLSKEPLRNAKLSVALALDYSGSMNRLYKNGTIQNVLERLIPIAMQFDDDNSMEFWLFDNLQRQMTPITINNIYDYVKREILSKGYHMGTTKYAPVMESITDYFTKQNHTKNPCYIIFITDGANSDVGATNKIIKQVSQKPIFWQYVGIGNDTFDYLQKLDDISGRYVDNADFFSLNDLNTISDDELYSRLLTELPNWLENPKVRDMLK